MLTALLLSSSLHLLMTTSFSSDALVGCDTSKVHGVPELVCQLHRVAELIGELYWVAVLVPQVRHVSTRLERSLN